MAKDYGHRFWGELERDDSNTVKQDLEKRLDFLIEYTRRVETSNLQAQEKLNTKYAKDEIFKSVNDFSDYHSRAFLHLMR